MSDTNQDGDKAKSPVDLFKKIKYYLIGNIDEKVSKLLDAGSAKNDAYLSQMVTHVICDDATHGEFSEAKELFELPVVTSSWVTMSLKCGQLLPLDAFSPETKQLFKDVVITSSQINAEDSKSLWTMVTFYGGQCQTTLDKRCTHLVTTNPAGAKYECALQHSDKIRIVTPDWIVDCIKEKTKLDEAKYHPNLLILETEEPENEELKEEQEPMQTEQTSPHGSASRSPVQGALLQRSGSESQLAKEALARMVNNRLSSTAKVAETPEAVPGMVRPVIPMATTPPSGSYPNMGRQMGNMPHGNMMGMINPNRTSPMGGHHSMGTPPGSANRTPTGTPPGSGVHPGGPQRAGSPGRSTLRNITNNSTEQMLAATKQNSDKIQQIINSISSSVTQVSPKARGNQFQARLDDATYYGHDGSDRVPDQYCLLGCVFYITDYNKFLEPAKVEVWKKVIEQHGGQMDTSYSNRVTHLLCEHQKSDVFQLALKDQKRVVTAHWLNDCLVKRKMQPPWLAIHFPSLYGDMKPCENQIITVSNFEGEERSCLKHMIQLIGAKYTGYMTHANSVLICKKLEGAKYEKAKEWRVPVVNVHWLNDLVLGHLSALKLPVNHRYQQFHTEDSFQVEMYKVAHLMNGWKVPLKIPKDAWKRISSIPTPLGPSGQENMTSGKRKAVDGLEENAAKRQRTSPMLPGAPTVIFTGIAKDQVPHLEQHIENLGGVVTYTPAEATHCISNSLTRTVKFLTCISVCKHIVTTAWVEESAKQGHFVDEFNFTLRDPKGEEQFGCNLAQAVLRSRERKLFKGLHFYLTPTVVPGPKTMKAIVEGAGGVLVTKRPSVRSLATQKNERGDPTFIVVSCDNDLHLVRDMLVRKVPVYNAEFILTGVIRQEVNHSAFLLTPQ